MKKLMSLCALGFIFSSCGDKATPGSGSSQQSYDFNASTSVKIKSSGLSSSQAFLQSQFLNPISNFLKSNSKIRPAGLENLCTGDSITCLEPTALTGIYYSIVFSLQSNNSSMTAYLMDKALSEITADSTSYEFDAKSPVVNTGNLYCCSGQGDLSGSNTTIESIQYLFGYIDVSFTAPSAVDGALSGTHTVRFVLADKAKESYVRGDILYKKDNVFQWVDANGNFSTTRPNSPITMNTKVTQWTAEDEYGNQKIPLISTQVGPHPKGGPYGITEDELKQENKTYTFDFDATYFLVIMKPTAELSSIHTLPELLSSLHIQGLPHSNFTFGAFSGTSNLSVE